MISSDVVRQQLAGVAATDHAPAAAYRPIFSQRTYRELGRRAAQAVTDGSGALVDATFHEPPTEQRSRRALPTLLRTDRPPPP
jgi:predicted kinase